MSSTVSPPKQRIHCATGPVKALPPGLIGKSGAPLSFPPSVTCRPTPTLQSSTTLVITYCTGGTRPIPTTVGRLFGILTPTEYIPANLHHISGKGGFISLPLDARAVTIPLHHVISRRYLSAVSAPRSDFTRLTVYSSSQMNLPPSSSLRSPILLPTPPFPYPDPLSPTPPTSRHSSGPNI